jgi:hypothetical protein
LTFPSILLATGLWIAATTDKYRIRSAAFPSICRQDQEVKACCHPTAAFAQQGRTPWQRPLRSRRIAAQSLSRISVARRGEYLVLKRLGQVSPLTESTAANKFNALFGGNPEDDEALRELFPDECTIGGRRRRLRAPRVRA